MSITTDILAYKDYLDLVKKVSHDIESLIQEIETKTINNLTERPPQDLLFEAIPLLRKLKHAKEEAETSIYHTEALLKKFL